MARKASQRQRSGLTDEHRQHFIEEMGLFFEQYGQARMHGRVLAYLILSSAPAVSSGELVEALHASAGSISTATRALTASGFIRRVAVPGDRRHHFRTDDDVWGTFLAGERKYLDVPRRLAEETIAALGTNDEVVRPRLSNMRDYMAWLAGYHRKMLADWEEFKRERDEETASSTRR